MIIHINIIIYYIRRNIIFLINYTNIKKPDILYITKKYTNMTLNNMITKKYNQYIYLIVSKKNIFGIVQIHHRLRIN